MFELMPGVAAAMGRSALLGSTCITCGSSVRLAGFQRRHRVLVFLAHEQLSLRHRLANSAVILEKSLAVPQNVK